jgi:hypothetical protein
MDEVWMKKDYDLVIDYNIHYLILSIEKWINHKKSKLILF